MSNQEIRGAAIEASKEGFPSVAFSGAGGAQMLYTSLSNTSLQSIIYAGIYSELGVNFVKALHKRPFGRFFSPVLPRNISLNVNHPSTAICTSANDFKFVLTRVYNSTGAQDVRTLTKPPSPLDPAVSQASACSSPPVSLQVSKNVSSMESGAPSSVVTSSNMQAYCI
ncbi:hypothetical protein C0991_009009, partial [Blastosporella zonata]